MRSYTDLRRMHITGSYLRAAHFDFKMRFIAHMIGLCYHKLTILSLDYVQ